MSEHSEISYACGIFKVDFKSAGYPDLMKIAREWAKDPNFYEIIVRGVSERNFGIQFLYISPEESSKDNSPIKKYKKELQEKFGEGFYAWDYSSGNYDSIQKMRDEMLVVFKPLE